MGEKTFGKGLQAGLEEKRFVLIRDLNLTY